MSAQEAVASFALQKGGTYVAKKLLDEHLSRDDAAKYKEMLGLETPDLRPKLDEISNQVADLSEIVKDLQKDLILQKYDSMRIKLNGLVEGYITAYDRFRAFAAKHQAAFKQGTGNAELIREANTRHEDLQAACKNLLTGHGAAYYCQQMVATASTKLATHNAPLFKVLHDIYTRDAVDVFTYSTKMNRLYNNMLMSITLAIRAIEEARTVYENPSGEPLLAMDLEYQPLVKLHASYLELTGRAHRLAHRLRDMARNNVNILLRRAVNNVRRDNLFLAGFSPGSHLSEVQSVGTGKQHGQIRTTYEIGTFDSTKKNSPPQIMTPAIAVGATHKITVNDKPLWGRVVGSLTGILTAPLSGPFGGAVSEIATGLIVNSSKDSFAHTTASQLWTVGIVKDGDSEYLTLRHVQSSLYLACESENWRTKLSKGGTEIRWRPILCAKDVPFPSKNEDDHLAFRLQGSLYGGKLLNSASNMAVVCNQDPKMDEQSVRWQIVSQTTVPEAECLYPGCYITSTNLLYSLQYTLDGNLVVFKKDVGKVRDINLPRVGQPPGKPGKLWMQDDGNLVQYDDSNPPKPMRASNTPNHSSSGAVLMLDNDGRVEIVSATGAVVASF